VISRDWASALAFSGSSAAWEAARSSRLGGRATRLRSATFSSILHGGISLTASASRAHCARRPSPPNRAGCRPGTLGTWPWRESGDDRKQDPRDISQRGEDQLRPHLFSGALRGESVDRV